jgi:hypothetical protein
MSGKLRVTLTVLLGACSGGGARVPDGGPSACAAATTGAECWDCCKSAVIAAPRTFANSSFKLIGYTCACSCPSCNGSELCQAYDAPTGACLGCMQDQVSAANSSCADLLPDGVCRKQADPECGRLLDCLLACPRQ